MPFDDLVLTYLGEKFCDAGNYQAEHDGTTDRIRDNKTTASIIRLEDISKSNGQDGDVAEV